jgi:hypothetical protein
VSCPQQHYAFKIRSSCTDRIRLGSAGGIIACGIGPGGLDVAVCAEKFANLSAKAFPTSRFKDVPVIAFLESTVRKIYSYINHGHYDSGPLEEALKDVLSKDRTLFGGSSRIQELPVKVAITTTTQENRVVVLSNYNRKPTERCKAHSFQTFSNPFRFQVSDVFLFRAHCGFLTSPGHSDDTYGLTCTQPFITFLGHHPGQEMKIWEA